MPIFARYWRLVRCFGVRLLAAGRSVMRNKTGPILFLAGVVMALAGWAEAEERYIFVEESNRWVPAGEIEEPLEGPLADIQGQMAAGEYRQAERALKAYLKAGPEVEDRQAAMLLYGDAALMRDRLYEAHKRYQKVIDEYPQTEEFAMALRRDLDIARAWLGGKKRRLWGIFRVPAQDEGVEILSQIEDLGHGYRIAEVALREKADYFYESGQFDLASIAYRRLADDVRSPRYTKMAMFRAASSALASFPGAAYDDTPLLEARELFNGYLNRFPAAAAEEDVDVLLASIEAKRAEKEYQIGSFYARIDRPKAAAYYYNYVLSTWPETLWAQRAEADLVRMGFEPGVVVQ